MLNFHTHRPQPGETATRSLGLHPWYLQSETLSDELNHLEHQLRVGSFQMVGECGLDKCCATPFALQQEAFLSQLWLAERLKMPVVIHCVHAYNELLALRRQPIPFSLTNLGSRTSTIQPQYWRQTWIVHGFTGTSQLAEELSRVGIFVSFGAAILELQRHKVREALQYLGSNLTIANAGLNNEIGNRPETPALKETSLSSLFFLETDESDHSIEEIYTCAAALLHIPLSMLTVAIDNLFMSLSSSRGDNINAHNVE